MHRSLVCAVVLLACAAAPAVAARGEEGDWELGVYLGQAFLDDYESSTLGVLGPQDDALFGVRAGRFLTSRRSLEFSAQRLETELDLNAEEARLDSFRLNYLWNFRPGEYWRPFLTIGLGLEAFDTSGMDSDDLGFNAGGGVRWFLGDRFGLRADGRVISMEVGSPVNNGQINFEATLGATWTFGGKPAVDSDGDGVNDGTDQCPDTPRGLRVDTEGCPPDADGDGVFDALDRCPDTPRGVPVDDRGCPAEKSDRDGDGIVDASDRCPDTRRGTRVDSSGCPVDSDGDGVPDGTDQCPDTPLGVRVGASGCPPDGDGDGVPDSSDRCPTSERGAKVNSSGCVDLMPPAQRTLLLEGVTFETDRARLLPASLATLDRVAQGLRDNPEVRVVIEGHTDSTGSAAHNQALSEARASAVRDYFIDKGIAAHRLTKRGFGGTKPVASNATPEGRARNRRVELTRQD